MGTKIYAPLNSVSSYKTYRTQLPLDITLTNEQKSELIRFEQQYDTGSSARRELVQIINSTDNEGIFFFCIENNFELREVAGNPNISKLVAFLLARLFTGSDKAIYHNGHMGALLRNPNMYSNIELLLSVFKMSSVDACTRFVSSLSPVLHNIPVEVLFFIISEVNLANSLGLVYVREVEKRQKDILQHMRNIDHPFVGLPFNWVLAAFGLKAA